VGYTTNYQIPYPELGDEPDGAGQMQALATQVDTKLKPIEDRVAVNELPVKQFIFTADGTWTKPAGYRMFNVVVQAGGGAGGGAAVTAAGTHSKGAGGGGGGWAESWLAATDLPATVAVTVGVGGNPILAGTGNNGLSSSFGSLVVATGGSGGQTAAASAVPFSGALGGAGGLGTVGQMGGSGTAGVYGWGNASYCASGSGGASRLGGGAFGRGTGASGAQSLAGLVGGNYGGGGSGAISQAAGAAQPGGTGAPGIVIVTCYA